MDTNLFNMYSFPYADAGNNPYVSQRASVSLYDQKKKDKEMFEAMQRERRFAAQRESAAALQQFQPEAQPSLFSGVKETVGGVFDPETLSKAEYDKAKSGSINPFITFNKEIVTDYTPTRGGIPKNPPRSADGTIIGDAPAGEIVYAPDGKTVLQDNRTSVNPHGDPNDGGMGVKEGTHTEYTKSIDRSYLAALAMSAIPEKKPTPTPRLPSGGGAHGGGPIPEMTQFLTGTRRKKRNPALWRYS